MKKTKNAGNGGVSPASRMEEEYKNNKYYRQAKFLLETFNENRMKRKQVEEELRKGARFTRDDAIYMIAGVKAVQYDSDHVQSSPKPDGMADKVLKIDEVVERMNREASNELTQELNKLSHCITQVNALLTILDLETWSVIKQRYVEGTAVENLRGSDGHRYHYKTSMELLHKGISQFADRLKVAEAIRQQAESENEKNEYMEEWYD